MSVSALPIRT